MINIQGLTGTGYEDWATAIITHHPTSKFELCENKRVRAYCMGELVAEYSFKDGTGFVNNDIVHSNEVPLEKVPNFQEMKLKDLMV